MPDSAGDQQVGDSLAASVGTHRMPSLIFAARRPCAANRSARRSALVLLAILPGSLSKTPRRGIRGPGSHDT